MAMISVGTLAAASGVCRAEAAPPSPPVISVPDTGFCMGTPAKIPRSPPYSRCFTFKNGTGVDYSICG